MPRTALLAALLMAGAAHSAPAQAFAPDTCMRIDGVAREVGSNLARHGGATADAFPIDAVLSLVAPEQRDGVFDTYRRTAQALQDERHNAAFWRRFAASTTGCR